MTSHCCLRLTNQLEAVVTGWFGAWEGTWALNLLALRPSPADTMPGRDSAESSGAFWLFCAICTQPARARTNPRASLSQWMWSWIMIVTAPTVTATAAIPIRMVPIVSIGSRSRLGKQLLDGFVTANCLFGKVCGELA